VTRGREIATCSMHGITFKDMPLIVLDSIALQLIGGNAHVYIKPLTIFMSSLRDINPDSFLKLIIYLSIYFDEKQKGISHYIFIMLFLDKR